MGPTPSRCSRRVQASWSLFDALYRGFLDLRTLCRLGHRQGVVGIGLVSLAERDNRLGRQNLDLMTTAPGRPRPVMGGGTGLEGNQGGLLFGQELGELLAGEGLVTQFLAHRCHHRYLDHVLCQIHANCIKFVHVWIPRSVSWATLNLEDQVGGVHTLGRKQTMEESALGKAR